MLPHDAYAPTFVHQSPHVFTARRPEGLTDALGVMAKDVAAEYLAAKVADPLSIAWGPFASTDAPAGYGVITDKLARGLSNAGARLLPPATFGWDVAVAIGLPHAWPFGYGYQRSDLCWHTMFEMDHLPDGWAGVLNKCALAWAPSQHSAQLFRDAGVRVPIGVVGYGVDTELFHSLGRQPHDKLRFLAWAPEFYGRKNLIQTAQAFYRADLPADECELEIKVNEGCIAPTFRDEDGAPITNIRVRAGSWQASQIADWLRSGDVLIYLSGGEGFGLQPLEAMACGCAVICADNTGMREYLSPEIALPVACPTHEKSINYSNKFPGGPFYQARPDYDQATELIRWCYDHQPDVQALGLRAAAHVRSRWTWQQAGIAALAMLREHFE